MEEKYPELPPEPQTDPRIPWQPARQVAWCEKNGGHHVEVKTWPPTRTPAPHEPPSMVAQCGRCDARLILYPDTHGVTIHTPDGVIKPDGKFVRAEVAGKK